MLSALDTSGTFWPLDPFPGLGEGSRLAVAEPLLGGRVAPAALVRLKVAADRLPRFLEKRPQGGTN